MNVKEVTKDQLDDFIKITIARSPLLIYMLLPILTLQDQRHSCYYAND